MTGTIKTWNTIPGTPLSRWATIALFAIGLLAAGIGSRTSSAQNSVLVQAPSSIRIGEKLTYSVSFGRFQNAGYAETNVVSRGKISGKEAIEIRSKVKTLELVSAAFFMFDESRTVYASPDTLLPLYLATNSNDSALPKETINNFLSQPTTNFDLVTLLFKLRESGGVGSYPFFEGERNYSASFVTTVAEKVKTEAGDFDTTVTTVQSDYLTATGIKDLKINLSVDEYRVPVQVRFKTARGEFRAVLSAIVLPEVETPTPTPTATPVRTPPPPTAKPTATPDNYVENAPLAPELGFQVGESLDYRITQGGKAIGQITFSARERTRVKGVDTLLLNATVTGIEQGTTEFKLGDTVTAQVDPDTLSPRSFESKLATPYPGLNPSVTFDPVSGQIVFGVKAEVDGPIGTHSILSLVYAMRSFNLKPSKDRSNPVNDTRVAVFWDTKPHIFTLRPSDPAEITVGGEKLSAQLISVNTGNPQLDKLALKVWLSTEQRVPLRFSVGGYQADLISRNTTLFR